MTNDESHMDVSLIITTYNWPRALKLTLESVLAQSALPHELIVADDGSKPETARIVKDVLSLSEIKWPRTARRPGGSAITN